ncbi:YciI family protein [Aliiroseovarius crassostreae]|uniref:YciI family protein n=1 Tax=Aliiroseovarius crassostreae TaxID=154981 RepID=UPI0021FAECB9|nr:YciI family protein [Aliiroseovarius crassostreae]UWP89267.1 YciI family protein [Aliiroseovarius crassostreae]
MPRFYMAYHMDQTGAEQAGSDPDVQSQRQARFQQWMQKHAAVLLVPMQPLGPQWTISEDGAQEGFAGSMMGYSILEAPDLETAKTIAADCPFCEIGNLQLAQMVELPAPPKTTT